MEMEVTASSVDDGAEKPRKGLFSRLSRKSRKSQKRNDAAEVPCEESLSVTPASGTSVDLSGERKDDSSAREPDYGTSATPPEVRQDEPRKGLLGRFRRKSRKSQKEEASDVPLEETSNDDLAGERKDDSSTRELDVAKSVTRDGNPVISSVTSDQFLPSEVRQDDPIQSVSGSVSNSPGRTGDAAKKSSRRGKREMVFLQEAPSARESAFGGPPRYDWIDIETAAAVKVQSAFRRNKVMWDLEKEGLSTAAMRNRQRARKSRQRAFHSEDVPSALACCGVGFLFGDATGEDQAVLAVQEREQYKERKRLEEEEEQKRRKYKYRKKASDHIVEEFEIIDD